MAKLPKEVEEKILALVKEERNASRVELGRRRWFERHCGERVRVVKVYRTFTYTDEWGADKQKEDRDENDEHVCIVCLVSCTFYSLSWRDIGWA